MPAPLPNFEGNARDTSPVPPRVSLVVPVFNGMPYLQDLTDSLLQQAFTDVEIVFSEGGGSDSSLRFLRSLDDPRVRIIEQPKGTSAAANWTAATQAAQGEYTKLICQDDLLYPSAIADQVEDLDHHPDAVMAIATRDIIDAHGVTRYRNRGLAGLDRCAVTVAGSDAIRACYLAGTNVIGEPLAVLFRTEPLLQHMPWRDDNPLMLDLSMYERVAPEGRVVLRRAPVGAFRVSGTSWSTRLARAQAGQTKQWQEEFADHAIPSITPRERRQAAKGRQRSIVTRRLAYTVLGWRGALKTPGKR